MGGIREGMGETFPKKKQREIEKGRRPIKRYKR